MKKILCSLLIISFLLLFGCKTQQKIVEDQECTGFCSDITPEEFYKLTYLYYQDPQPDRIGPILNFMIIHDLMVQEFNPNIVVFLSDIFRQNPSRLEEWIMDDLNGLNGLTVNEWDTIVSAIWQSNITESQPLLDEIRENLITNNADSSYIEYIDNLPEIGILNVKEIEANEIWILDILWASYFASGEEIYIKKIISAIPMMESEIREEVTIGSVAKWSLESNSKHHPNILEICAQEPICDEELFTSNEEIKDPIMQEVIDKQFAKDEEYVFLGLSLP